MWRGISIADYTTEKTLDGYRVVENQGFSATLSLVDDRDEHELLERLIEESKPAKPEDCSIDDYLLFTPFRYPPLREGTRFGRVTQRSPFYGAEHLEAALAEKSYRIFWFDSDTEANFPPRSINYTSFMFHAHTKHCLDLLVPPFEEHYAAIHDKDSHTESQKLGDAMREEGAEACLFHSVRCVNAVNIALFTPQVFTKKSTHKRHWLCHISNDNVRFLQDRKVHYSFERYT